jgi:hypothetical protein
MYMDITIGGHREVEIELVPNMRAGRCLGPEGTGVSLREGAEGGPGTPEGSEDKQSMLSEEGGNLEKEEEGNELGMMKKNRR